MISARSDREDELTTLPIDERGNIELLGASQGEQEEFTGDNVNTTATQLIENLDPERRRMVRGKRTWLQRLARRWFWWLLPRKETPEERDHRLERARRARELAALRDDAIACQKWMIGALNRLGLCYAKRDTNGNIKRINSVRFDCVRVEPDALHFHVDIHHLPWGVSIPRLVEQETLDNLGAAVGRAVSCRYTPEVGVWYSVERASGRAGIPNRVMIKDMWDFQPASSGPLSIPVGVTHNARRVYQDLGKMIHCLVGGTTGSGKTNFLHVIICSLIRRNSPENMRMALVDLKGGLAFSRYEGIPHLMTHEDFCPTGVVQDREHVFKLLSWLIVEGERRMGQLKEAGCEDIGQYNSRRKRGRLPFIVVIIDEWADMMQTDKKQAEGALVNVVSRMRSVGMHVILSTQSPKAEVVTGLIKGNLPGVFAFSVPSLHASMAIMDSKSAVGLQPTGRCVMRFASERQVQTPYISPELVRDVIHEVTTGEALQIGRHDVTPREVQEYALENLDGWLTRRGLWEHYKDRKIAQEELMQWVDEWTGQTFVVNGAEYKVIEASKPGTGNHISRRLVAVTEEKEG